MMMAEARGWWIASLIAGLVAVGCVVAFGRIPVVACDGMAADAMLRFELVTSVPELRSMFTGQLAVDVAHHVGPCGRALAAGFDRINRIDVFAFIPAFTLLQIFAAIALRRQGQRLAGLVIIMAVVAALSDQIEDQQLFAITAALPGTQAMVDVLMWASRIKFALLAVAALDLGLLSLRLPGARRWLGAVMMAGGVVCLFGLLTRSTLITSGIGAAWVALLLLALWGSIRPTLMETHTP
jgi:hypothetical protein